MGLCEAHLTMLPTFVAKAIREDVFGNCQQKGCEGARLVPHGQRKVNHRLNLGHD